MCGDCTESTVLLHSLADRYTALGDVHVAAGLLRRAVVRQGSPVSGSALDAALRARIALGECLAAGGSLGEAAAQYSSVATAAATLPGEVQPQGVKDSIRHSKVTAAGAAAALLTQLGRHGEADKMRLLYGGRPPSSTQRAGTA